VETLDAVVVGAGPAGVAAALGGRTQGLSTVVVDKARFPRDKTCGDGLTTAALRSLERVGVDLPQLLGESATVDEVVLLSPSGREVVLPLPIDGRYAAVVPRAALDAALVGHARENGVDVRAGVGVVGIERDARGVDVVLTTGDKLRTRYVIAADGHYSAVRRLVGDQVCDLGTWHAFRQYVLEVDDPRLWVIFERDLLPGYAWVFPVGDGRANVGFGVLRTPEFRGKQLAGVARGLLDRGAVREVLGPHARAEGPPRAWPIPAEYDPARLADDRVLYTGDAAGVVDRMTGEGIAQALETGLLASDAIAHGGTPGAVARRYRNAVDRSLGRDLRLAAKLQGILASPLGARAAVRAAGLTPWTRRNFARWMFEDYPRALAFTPDRWHRGAFTTPGAYRESPMRA